MAKAKDNTKKSRLTKEVYEKACEQVKDLAEAKQCVDMLGFILRNPTSKMHIALVRLMDKLSKDILKFAEKEGSILTDDKEDKAFDRINQMVTKWASYKDATKANLDEFKEMGIAIVDSFDDDDSEELSAFDRRANQKKAENLDG
jgi:hypothetical protein